MKTLVLGRYRIWLILATICLIQLIVVLLLQPTNFFGWSGDDAIYFSSAKALAEGKGYVLPSIPGTPPATKYPILYPWLLSWVWRWNPSFPGNLNAAMVVNIAFGFAFVIMAFLFLRRLSGLGATGAVIVTALCAFHPIVLLYVANLTTDIPFAATVLSAILLASRALNKNCGLAAAVFGGFVGGISMLLRVLGLPIAVGLLLAHALGAGWRKSAAFLAGVLPFFAALLIRLIASAPAKPVTYLASSACEKSWQLTWIYFTSYPAFWKASAIENHAFWSYLTTNITFLIYQVGAYLIDLRHIRITPLSIILFTSMLLITARGSIRKATSGISASHLALGFYLVPLLIWDYPSLDRFLIPFLPLILAGAWIEFSRIAKTIIGSLKTKPDLQARFAVAICTITGIALITAAGVTWWRATALIVKVSTERSALLVDKREAYQWLRQHSSPGARTVAYESASAFLYSERQGITPTVLLASGKYQQQILAEQLACLLAPAEPIGATYWVAADDDFRLEWTDATVREKAIERELEASHTLLFRSQAGHVRIYKLSGPGDTTLTDW
jgi:hypothetical protein